MSNDRVGNAPENRRVDGRPPVTFGRLLGLAVGTFLIGVACSFVGHYRVAVPATWSVWEWELWASPLWATRVFRLLAAATVGAGLASAGTALQALLRNPLAEPYTLGISSGAGVGVLLGPTLAPLLAIPAAVATPVLAAFGAIATAVCVYLIAQRHGRLDPYVLLLSGVIVNVFNGALILMILQFAKQEEMIHFIGWGMGQIPEYLWHQPGMLAICSTIVVVAWGLVIWRGAAFNVLGLGDEVAASSGVSVHRLRLETFLVTSVMTAAAVALAGPIGFVGLIVPHATRMLFGADHRRLTILAGFFGAVFLMGADTLCRVIGQSMGVGEFPVGVLTAMTGAPFFIMILRRPKQSRRFGHR